MDWGTATRVPLTPSVNPMLETIAGAQGPKWAEIRKETLHKANNRCRHCNGYYEKYLTCHYVDNKTTDAFCRACYIITHLNFGFANEVRLCYSTMSQLEIVKKTINHIVEYETIPEPHEIDSKAQPIQLSIPEFCIFLLENANTLSPSIRNYKVFFTTMFDISFVQSNINNLKFMLNDDDETTTSDPTLSECAGYHEMQPQIHWQLVDFFSPKQISI